MSNPLQALEARAYQRAYSDGMIDLFVGVSLLWIGTAWLWLPDLAALAGILPAVFAPFIVTGRKTFVEERTGYVRWSEPRRNREHRSVVLALIVGILMFIAAVVAFFVVDRLPVDEDVTKFMAPGILAWLLALLCLILAYILDTWRFLVYAVVLSVAGLITAIEDANPGLPMLAAGAVMTIAGLIMMVGFVRLNPKTDAE